MSSDGLHEMFARIPRVEAVTVRPASGPAHWRAAWSLRHTLATLLALPLLFAANSGAAGSDAAGDPLSIAVVGTISLIGALVVASFLPPRGAKQATLNGCAGASLLALFASGALLQDLPGSVVSGLLALTLATVALGQRLFTASTC